MPYENRSPFRLLYTSLASYLLFPSPSLSGACLVAAGSALASELGFAPRSSLLTAPATALLSPTLLGAVVLLLTTALGLIVGLEAVGGLSEALGAEEKGATPWACSSWYCFIRLWRSASAFWARSALMDFLAK